MKSFDILITLGLKPKSKSIEVETGFSTAFIITRRDRTS